MATALDDLNLPDWLREAFETGEPTDVVPNKRADSRHHWQGSCFAQPDCALVHGLNLGPTGIGFLSREPFSVGQMLSLFPGDGSGEPVRVRVIHCTQTVGRYKIGGVLEQGSPPKKSH